MNLRRALSDLARVIADEVERSPEFRKRVLGALGHMEKAKPAARELATSQAGRSKNRRAPAVLDPIEVAASGEETLRSVLITLTVEQLQDIISDFGMDPGRLVVKWKTPERIIDRIVEIAVARAQKGDAFRSER